MTINRWAARSDSTRAAIVAALREGGASVYDVRRPCDLLVGYRGQTVLVECKRTVGKRKPRAAGYTPAQDTFMAGWLGGPVVTLTDAQGARALLAMLEQPGAAQSAPAADPC